LHAVENFNPRCPTCAAGRRPISPFRHTIESKGGEDEMRAITIRQPWAELIIRGEKDVENRSWRTNHRGALLNHAGVGVDQEGFGEHDVSEDDVDHGAIIGVVELVECT
jgi:hypothetical protein